MAASELAPGVTIFDPRSYVPDYQKVSDIEITKGARVHPKNAARKPEGYAKDEIIIAICGKHSTTTGLSSGVGAVYVGPGNDMNKYINYINGAGAIETLLTTAFEVEEMAYTLKHFAKSLSLPAFLNIDNNSKPGHHLRKVIIKHDSDFLEEILSNEGLAAMEQRGWKTAAGTTLSDLQKSKAKQVWEKFQDLPTKYGLEVALWKVTAAENADAHKMEAVAHRKEPC
jgi:vacuolar-type H+-ATPase subunit F/Vma7